MSRHHAHTLPTAGPFCQICTLNEDVKYVWNGDVCTLCDEAQKAGLWTLISVLILITIAIISYIVYRRDHVREYVDKHHMRDRRVWLRLLDTWQTRYKTVVRFFQTLSRITVLYPFSLPAAFTGFYADINFLSFDINVLPIGCVAEMDFHDRLVFVTVFPLVFVGVVVCTYMCVRVHGYFKRPQQTEKAVGHMMALCIYITIFVLYTVFSLVSSTIFQTFAYDDRLGNGLSYLSADYSIEQHSESHQWYVQYAIGMAVLYCGGIPLFSLLAMAYNKKSIQKMQRMLYSIQKVSFGWLGSVRGPSVKVLPLLLLNY
jgi:heme/copper-type cytochrome/quinol oxidase subunit 2